MSKKNVAYIKPQEPAFLARLKKEVGYKEGPTVDTKREALPQYASDDSEGEDQQPVIVVVNPGDLTAEEVAQAKKEEVADLSKRVLFKKPVKKRAAEDDQPEANKLQKADSTSAKHQTKADSTSAKHQSKADSTSAKHQTKADSTSAKKSAKPSSNKGPLSFSEEAEEDY